MCGSGFYRDRCIDEHSGDQENTQVFKYLGQVVQRGYQKRTDKKEVTLWLQKAWSRDTGSQRLSELMSERKKQYEETKGTQDDK